MVLMARPREFDTDAALDGAIAVFREHGFEGTSAQMLVDAMGIGRQSLYAAFGDKWQLYCSAARRYGMGECAVHFDALRSGPRAIDGIYAMLRRVVETADQPCLGVSSIYEFGASRPDLKEIKFIGLAGYPNVLVWGPSGWAFDYPFADWRGPTDGWGNP
jgi:TetR/AcrR family transcriptional repressor of nem operon